IEQAGKTQGFIQHSAKCATFICAVSKPMSAVILASNDKQKYSTLCGVVISHILLLWSLSYLKTDVRIESHSPENAIQIRFISLNKTDVVQQSSTKLQTASEQVATQSKAQPQSTVATAVQHQQQVKVIHST
ncbi:hypothetical protein, partial [Corynebacterium striatum]|uniref:hypothetical protein n=1 Tax=Corynebacterium striatum TaxID=43770 RepID=UPI003F7D9592